MILLVSYDLKGHERPAAYTAVRDLIEKNAMSCRRILFSQWLVETDKSCDRWTDLIATVADSTDRWFVVRVTHENQGFLDKDTWPWLNARI